MDDDHRPQISPQMVRSSARCWGFGAPKMGGILLEKTSAAPGNQAVSLGSRWAARAFCGEEAPTLVVVAAAHLFPQMIQAYPVAVDALASRRPFHHWNALSELGELSRRGLVEDLAIASNAFDEDRSRQNRHTMASHYQGPLDEVFR